MQFGIQAGYFQKLVFKLKNKESLFRNLIAMKGSFTKVVPAIRRSVESLLDLEFIVESCVQPAFGTRWIPTTRTALDPANVHKTIAQTHPTYAARRHDSNNWTTGRSDKGTTTATTGRTGTDVQRTEVRRQDTRPLKLYGYG